MNRDFLLKRMGSIHQVCGTKRYQLTDGKSAGVEAVDLYNRAGVGLTVLPGRGMDLHRMTYKGINLSYLSKTGIASPAYYESDEFNWLRNFYAGMLTTCGLRNAGVPCEENGRVAPPSHQGLHGRIANTGAENVCVSEEWQGEDYLLTVSGRLKESMLHEENYRLDRTVTMRLDQRGVDITDRIYNDTFYEWPLMVLYHFNVGYPLLDEGALFFMDDSAVEPNTGFAEERLDNHIHIEPPQHAMEEQLFFHTPKNGEGGLCRCGVINEKLNLALIIRYDAEVLPYFAQWKMMGEQEYVLGLEPGNCRPIGLHSQRKLKLEMLPPGGMKDVRLSLEIIDTPQEIAALKKTI